MACSLITLINGVLLISQSLHKFLTVMKIFTFLIRFQRRVMPLSGIKWWLFSSLLTGFRALRRGTYGRPLKKDPLVVTTTEFLYARLTFIISSSILTRD